MFSCLAKAPVQRPRFPSRAVALLRPAIAACIGLLVSAPAVQAQALSLLSSEFTANDGTIAVNNNLTLAGFSEPELDPSFVPTIARRLNFAKYQRAVADDVHSTYLADYAFDGIVSNSHAWRVGSRANHWLEITYPRPVTLGSAHLYSGLLEATTSQVWKDFRLQSHNGSTWVDVPGSIVTNNTSPERVILFTSPVTASRFRLLGDDRTNNRTVRELALFPPNPNGSGVEQGYPIGTDVVLNLAHKRPTVASTIDGTHYAIKATDGYVHDSSRWLCADTTAGQTLEIDLLADHAIGSAHLHSGDYATQGNALANFTLQSWNAGTLSWVNIPGATITGNTNMARVVTFSSTVTTSKVRLVAPNATLARIAELQIFPPRTGGYPVGQNIRYEAPPAFKWNDYSDDSHRIRITPAPDRRIGLVNGSALFTDDNAGPAALDWQLLLNHRDGSYRIRHVRTGHCLALGTISTAPNTPVVGETYTGMPHQNWFLIPVTSQKFRLFNAYSGLALQPLGDNETVGTPLVVTTPGPSLLQRWDTARQTHFPKKGIAGTTAIIRTSTHPYTTDPNLTFHRDFYNRLGGSWSYGWGRQSAATFPYLDADLVHAYNPMQWGDFSWDHGSSGGPLEGLHRELQSNPKPVHYLGFNEPEKTQQGYILPADAIRRWPRFMALDVPLVAPVPASIPVNSSTSPATPAPGWLNDFVIQADALGYRRDYTSVHWYAGPNSTSLINRLEDVYEAYGRPVWLTEFSTVRWSGTHTWTDASNFNFLAEFLWRAESLPWLKRYSIFVFIEGPTDNPNQGAPDPDEAPRSNTLRADGSLTAFGELYAGWDGVAAVVNNKSYHLHNRGVYGRVRNPGSASTPSDAVASVSPETAASGNQWFLMPGATANTVRIVSTLDRRRLRHDAATYVGLAPTNDFTAQSEWLLVENQHGWFFLQHPQTATRLRLLGDGTLGTGPDTATTHDYNWRFVVPAVSDPLVVPDAPASLAATASISAITLSWASVSGATSYTVYRATSANGPWTALNSNVVVTTYADTTAVFGTTYYYLVTATNLQAYTSAPSVVAATLLPPPDPFVAWVAEKLSGRPPADQLPNADPDGDGLSNFLEYALSSDPLVASGTDIPACALSTAGTHLQLTFLRTRAELTYEVLASSTLAPDSWLVVATNPGVVSTTTPVTVTDPEPALSRRFLRLRVTR